MIVKPGSNYATPEYETDIQTIKEQCKAVIVENSWRMVFARNQEEFDALLKDMRATVNGLGYKKALDVDMENVRERFAAEAQISGS